MYSSLLYLRYIAKGDEVDKHFGYLCPHFFQDIHEVGVVVISGEGGESPRTAEQQPGGGGVCNNMPSHPIATPPRPPLNHSILPLTLPLA